MNEWRLYFQHVKMHIKYVYVYIHIHKMVALVQFWLHFVYIINRKSWCYHYRIPFGFALLPSTQRVFWLYGICD